MRRVLVLEDDALLAGSLVRALRHHGFSPRAAGTIAEAERDLEADVIITDLGLPDGDGLGFVRRAAASRPHVPIIVLTGRTSTADIVLGLRTGAVDYVTKPFHLSELIARVDSHCRFTDQRVPEHDVIEFGQLLIDRSARQVRSGTRELDLRPREFDLLVRLATDAGKVVPRTLLMNDVWHQSWWSSTKTLDVHVNSIRRKLGDHADCPLRITAVRGVGYRLEARRCDDV